MIHGNYNQIFAFPVYIKLLAMNSRNSSTWQKFSHREASQCNYNLRAYYVNHLIQIEFIGFNLIRFRITILGRAMMNNICNKYFFPNQACGSNKLVEKCSGVTHKRSSLLVFIKSRSFTYKHDFGFM